MMQRGLVALLGLGAALAVTIALELGGGVSDDGAMIAPAPRPAPAPPSRAAVPLVPQEDRQALADGILARPLFATNRRPPDAPAAAGPASAPTNLPRLAGILVHGDSRSAIFAAAGSGRPAVVQEGAQLSGYTVQAIEAGQVTLAGPGGSQVLHPAFDPRPPSPAAGPLGGGLPGAGLPGAGLPGVGPGSGPGARPATPFAPTDVLQSLRGLTGTAR